MSRVGSSLRRLLFVEVRADPPSANGIFARNVRQIDQEALLRISYFPPRPRTKKAESARQLSLIHIVRHQVETAQCGHVADFPILITKSQIARRTASRSRPSLLQPARTKPPVCRNGHKKNHGRTERTTNSPMHRRRKHGGRRCERPNSASYRRKKHSAQRLILSRSFAIPD